MKVSDVNKDSGLKANDRTKDPTLKAKTRSKLDSTLKTKAGTKDLCHVHKPAVVKFNHGPRKWGQAGGAWPPPPISLGAIHVIGPS